MQADCYRPLRLPTVLVGDPKLGGISSTISAYESLSIRGYDIDSVILFKDDFYKNWQFLLKFFYEKDIRVETFPLPPPMQDSPNEDRLALMKYFDTPTMKSAADEIIKHLDERHNTRIRELDEMSDSAITNVWWPFVQHGLLKKEEISVIDSAHGDFFHVYSSSPTDKAGDRTNRMSLHFDGSASWWTQTFGHSHPSIAFAASRAAGRYGHVLFPQTIHAPALALTRRLLSSVGKGWASRVYISDDGSTAMEVALKMALRAYYSWTGQELTKMQKQKLGILGLKGSYHGDTIGAMDACEAGDGIYTCEWHTAKGYWFDPPTIGFRNGHLTVTIPKAVAQKTGMPTSVEVESMQWAYDVPGRLNTDLHQLYKKYVLATLENLEDVSGMSLGALVLEPLLMGAGGMVFVDPLFQRVLVDIARERNPKLPVIFDEVFVGLHRLGHETCASLLGVYPDIAVYAKALTGGTVPLAVTLASSSIFEVFRSDKKSDALLHGHSYTAHPIGCEVANESLRLMSKVTSSNEWKRTQEKWYDHTLNSKSQQKVWSFFGPQLIETISRNENVEWAMSLGTVLAFRLKGDDEGEFCLYIGSLANLIGVGYDSHIAKKILSSIGQPTVGPDECDSLPFGIHMRSLGDVAYFMTSLNTPTATVRSLEKGIIAALMSKS